MDVLAWPLGHDASRAFEDYVTIFKVELVSTLSSLRPEILVLM